MKYNPIVLTFLNSQGIDCENVPSVFNRTLDSSANITLLAHENYAIYGKQVNDFVLVADVYGLKVTSSKTSFLNAFDLCFDISKHKDNLYDCSESLKNEENFIGSSIGLLNYNTYEVIEQLLPSYTKEPIEVRKIDDKCFITEGNRRILILMFHYFKELSFHPEKESFLNRSFKVPAKVRNLDIELSGINFLLKMKYGNRISMLANDYTECFSVNLDGKKYEMSKQELKTLVRYEYSIKNCTFKEFRSLFIAALSNAKGDTIFRQSLIILFPELENINFEQVCETFIATEGLEQIFENMNLDDLSLNSIIEIMKTTLLKHYIESINDVSLKRKKIRELLEKITKEQDSIEKTYQELLTYEEKERFYRSVLEKEEQEKNNDIYDRLEQEEANLCKKIEQLQKRKFVFLRKKRMDVLRKKLAPYLMKLEETPFWSYQEKKYTYRQFKKLVEQAKEFDVKDQRALRLELDKSIHLLEKQKRKYELMNDGFVSITSLKIFCDSIGIDFNQMLTVFEITMNVEEKRVPVYCRR